MSCPRSDAKRPGAAPKALGVCFSDFFGVGNLLGCRLHRGPEARTDRRGWTGAGKLRAALGIVGSRNWSELWELFLLRGVQQMEGLAVNELIQVNDLIPPWNSVIFRYSSIDSTIEQDNHCVKSMWGENHAHDIFVPLQIWLLVP